MSGDVLVVAEHRQGELRAVTQEAIAAGDDISAGGVEVVLIGATPDAFLDQLELAPVDTVHTFEHAGEFNHDVYVQVLEHLVQTRDPAAVVAGNTVNGLDYLPALATTVEWPIVTDAIALSREGDEIEVTREGYGSKVETDLVVERPPCVISVRPGEWDGVEEAGDASVSTVDFTLDESSIRTAVTGLEAMAAGDVDITEAEVLVSVGRGIGEEENLELIEALADAIGATISASRPIVDAGWLPKNRQVGQSGKTVDPDVYLAIGISGAVQHVAGMKGADAIVAINNDPDAPIFELADVGIVDDLFEVVPALVDEFTA